MKLTWEKRLIFRQRLDEKIPITDIAKEFGMHRSALYLELKKNNATIETYDPYKAYANKGNKRGRKKATTTNAEKS